MNAFLFLLLFVTVCACLYMTGSILISQYLKNNYVKRKEFLDLAFENTNLKQKKIELEQDKKNLRLTIYTLDSNIENLKYRLQKLKSNDNNSDFTQEDLKKLRRILHPDSYRGNLNITSIYDKIQKSIEK